jgi:hypothetical protein
MGYVAEAGGYLNKDHRQSYWIKVVMHEFKTDEWRATSVVLYTQGEQTK